MSLWGCGAREVLLWCPDAAARAACPSGATPCADEAELLALLCRRIRELDPDVLTGWSIIDFDVSVLIRQAAAVGVALELGRAPGELRQRGDGERRFSDSVFDAAAQGERLAEELTEGLARYIAETWRVRSALQMEFETLFERLFLPPLRSGERGATKRYVGLTGGRLHFTGMEVVRSDWTELAHEVQRELYSRLFDGDPVDDYLRQVIHEVSAGQRDRQLVYRKALRKEAGEYPALPLPRGPAPLNSTDPRTAADLLNRHVRRDLAGGHLITDGAPARPRAGLADPSLGPWDLGGPLLVVGPVVGKVLERPRRSPYRYGTASLQAGDRLSAAGCKTGHRRQPAPRTRGEDRAQARKPFSRVIHGTLCDS